MEGKPGTTLELITDLNGKFPGIGQRISDGDKIRRFVNIYINDEDIRFLNAEETAIRDGDEVYVVPAIAGGRT